MCNYWICIHILCHGDILYTTSQVFVCLLQGDNSRERALDDMMDGVLEVKKIDILKMVSRNIKVFVKHKYYIILIPDVLFLIR